MTFPHSVGVLHITKHWRRDLSVHSTCPAHQQHHYTSDEQFTLFFSLTYTKDNDLAVQMAPATYSNYIKATFHDISNSIKYFLVEVAHYTLITFT